jgi:hypothetical protein
MTTEQLQEAFGPNLTRATKHVAALLKKHKLNAPFHDPQLLSLLQHQPRKAIHPAKVEGFVRAKRPPYNRPCLYAVMADGEYRDFSYIRCLRKLYGRYDAKREKRLRVLNAFRLEAFRSKGMQSAHQKIGIGRCSSCQKRCKLAIDHSGKPFAQIVDEFIEREEGLRSLDDVAIAWAGRAGEFRCRQLATRWCAWHDQHAKLAGLCRSCNSAKGSGGYKHRA